MLPFDFALAHLYGEKGDRRYERAALRYLERYMAEEDPPLEDVAPFLWRIFTATRRGAISLSACHTSPLPPIVGCPTSVQRSLRTSPALYVVLVATRRVETTRAFAPFVPP